MPSGRREKRLKASRFYARLFMLAMKNAVWPDVSLCRNTLAFCHPAP
jgi:hypothetical protein